MLDGDWTQSKRVFLRFPVYDHLNVVVSQWWAWLAHKAGRDNLPINMNVLHNTDGPDRTRNLIVRDFLRSDCTHLWMIDADVVPPQSLEILEYDYPVVAGWYDLFDAKADACFPHVYTKHPENRYTWRPFPIDQWPDAPVFKVGSVALGCVLIERSILSDMRPPWFDMPEKSNGAYIGEDSFFFDRVDGAWVVKGYECHHIRECDLTHVRRWWETVRSIQGMSCAS